MNSQTFANKLKTYKKGTYTRITWVSTTESGFSKVSTNVVRLLENEVKVSKAGNEYIHFFLTNNRRHKVKVSYFDNNGIEITQTQFESIVGKKEYNITTCFSKRISDILAWNK